MRKHIAASLFALVLSTGAFVTTEAPAQEIIKILQAPPQAQPEIIPAPPSQKHIWVHGFWRWDTGANKHIWVQGRYELPKTNGHVWYPNRWSHDNGHWVFVPGRWAAPHGQTTEILMAPPPPQIEVVKPAPSNNHFWVGGHWRWEGGKHVWVPGHYEVRRRGSHYEPAHWSNRGGRWHYVPGHWRQ
jgi:hypothetical protein